MAKFTADSMLGKLAKWLMIAGFDVAYIRENERQLIMDIARNEDRIVLTRDTRLSDEKIFFIESDILWEQLEQVLKIFGPPPENKAFSRCIECNCQLVHIEKKMAEGKTPPYVYKVHNDFSQCPSCGKIFWAGSHYRKMQKILRKYKERQ